MLAMVLQFTPSALLEAQLELQAPAFDLNDSNDVTFHFPGDLEEPTIVLFWASWCPYCKALMPHLQSIVDEYDGQIAVLAFNFRDDEDPTEFQSEYGYDFHIFPQADAVADMWGVKGTPGLFLVDGTGRIIFSNFSIPEDAYRANLTGKEISLTHYQKAARKAPFWAAQLRLAIDKTGEF